MSNLAFPAPRRECGLIPALRFGVLLVVATIVVYLLSRGYSLAATLTTAASVTTTAIVTSHRLFSPASGLQWLTSWSAR